MGFTLALLSEVLSALTIIVTTVIPVTTAIVIVVAIFGFAVVMDNFRTIDTTQLHRTIKRCDRFHRTLRFVRGCLGRPEHLDSCCCQRRNRG
jgi:hypothetical protein